MKAVRAFIGLGSNVGARLRRLQEGARALSSLPGTGLKRLSPVYETSPVGPKQRMFLNAAAEIRTKLPPPALLRALKGIEKALGRRRRKKWGPRELDLDILFYGDGAGRAPGLTWPHPRFRERKFVLGPLRDLAPRLKDPVTGRTVRSLWSALTAPDQRIRLFRRCPPIK